MVSCLLLEMAGDRDIASFPGVACWPTTSRLAAVILLKKRLAATWQKAGDERPSSEQYFCKQCMLPVRQDLVVPLPEVHTFCADWFGVEARAAFSVLPQRRGRSDTVHRKARPGKPGPKRDRKTPGSKVQERSSDFRRLCSAADLGRQKL